MKISWLQNQPGFLPIFHSLRVSKSRSKFQAKMSSSIWWKISETTFFLFVLILFFFLVIGVKWKCYNTLIFLHCFIDWGKSQLSFFQKYFSTFCQISNIPLQCDCQIWHLQNAHVFVIILTSLKDFSPLKDQIISFLNGSWSKCLSSHNSYILRFPTYLETTDPAATFSLRKR